MADHEEEKRQKLYHMLRDDLDTPEEADDLLPVVMHLRKWSAPQATTEQTSALLSKLAAELPVQRRSRWQQVTESWPLLLVRSQVRVVGHGIWVASALVMLLGTIITLATFQSSGTVLLALVAPIVAAIGVALLYDSDIEQMLELENTTAASAHLLLLARLTLVFGFNLLLGLAGSLVLALVRTEVSLWPLVLSWLAPMAFLSALAFLLSVLFVDALVSTAVSLTLWGLHVALRTFPLDRTTLTYLLSLPGLNQPINQPVLFLSAGLLLLAALWLVQMGEYRRGVTL